MMNNNKKDYYKILGVTDDEKKLSSDEFGKVLKKKYHKLCTKYHPDKWTNSSENEKKDAEEKFKEIAEAYETLSDPNKRNQYDNMGMGFDFSMFEHFGFNPFGGSRQRVNKGTNAKAYAFMTIKEAYNGGERKIKVKRDKICKKCNGTGSSDGTSTTCPHCNGTGMITETKQMGPGSFSMSQRPCNHCHGSGKIIKKPCNHCNGNGVVSEETIETFNIPKGVGNGMIINVPGAGNAPLNGNGINGDLHIEIIIKDDNYFTRVDEINLVHYADIPFNECLLGFEKEFDAIDGTKVKVKAKELTKHGETFTFKGKGMPHPQYPHIVGDYAVVVRYKLPDNLTKEQKDKLKNF